MNLKIILWTLYGLLVFLIALDMLTTAIGLNKPDIKETNKLARDHFFINASIQLLILIILGAIIHYLFVITKNIEVITG